jgi:hypothetical protein
LLIINEVKLLSNAIILFGRAYYLKDMLALLLRTRCIIYGSPGAPDSPDMQYMQENLPVVQCFDDNGVGVQSIQPTSPFIGS